MIDQLKAIKPIVSIPDNSLIYLLIIVFVSLIALLMIIKFWIKKLKSSKNYLRKNALRQLQNLDFTNPKIVAYDFNRYANFLLNDYNKKQYEQIQNMLIDYKYKKQVGVLSDDLITKIREFIRV